MIRLIIKIANWLDKRFPERVEIKKADYDALLARLGVLEANIIEVQTAAVHKSAVRDVISAVQAVKDDLSSLKASLGFNRPAEAMDPQLLAVLNGEHIS